MSNLNEEDIAIIQERELNKQEEKNEDIAIDAFVMDNIIEWSNLITELSENEIQLYKSKEAYEKASEKLLKDAAKEKAENDKDIIKKRYGGNNDKTRAKYVKEMLSKDGKEIKDIEFRIDYLKRRISFLKQLIHTKTIIMEVKE